MKKELLYKLNNPSHKKVFGSNIHLLPTENGTDWAIEAILRAEHLAFDNGVELPMIPDGTYDWSYTYYCEINKQKYKVTHSREHDLSEYKLKIESA
jgi:hypothetical protein